LGAALDPRRNSINALRLSFALLILLLHCTTLSGALDEMPSLIFDDTLGTYALSGFFVMSGYLIIASRLSSPGFGNYMWRRVLRMYPAWIASLALVGLALGPLSSLIAGSASYDWDSGLSYITRNLTLAVRQWGVLGTLGDVPVVGTWNFSAWTLFYEFGLWIGMGLLVTFWPRRHLTWGAWLGFAMFTAVKVADLISTGRSGGYSTNTTGEPTQHGLVLTIAEPLSRLGIFFMAGALLYLYRDRVRLRPALLVVCAVVSAVLAVVGWFHTFAALPFAYVIMYAASSSRFARVNYPDDYSYGVYIYAFPITQVIATYSVFQHHLPLPLFMLIVTALTFPLAWLSWHYLEKPALSLKKISLKRRRAVDRESVA